MKHTQRSFIERYWFINEDSEVFKEASTDNKNDKHKCSENEIDTIEQSFNKTNVLPTTVNS